MILFRTRQRALMYSIPNLNLTDANLCLPPRMCRACLCSTHRYVVGNNEVYSTQIEKFTTSVELIGVDC